MSELFNSAIALMNRLKYPYKFILVSLLFALPLLLAMILLTSESNSQEKNLNSMLRGVYYLSSLERLENAIEQDSLATTETSRAKITQAIKDLSVYDRLYGELLNSTSYFSALQEKWNNAGDSTALHKDSLVQTDELYNQVFTTSGLKYTDQPGLYFLATIIQLDLHRVQNLIWQIKSTKSGVNPAVQVELLRTNLQNVKQELTSALRSGDGRYLKDALGKSLAGLDNAINQFNEISGSFEQPPDSLSTIITTLQEEGTTALSQQLQLRINQTIQERYLVVFFAIVMLGLVGYILIGFYLAVMRTVSTLEDASHQMISGNLNHEIKVANQDELGQVVLAFNQVAQALVSTGNELSIRQKNSQSVSARLLSFSTNLKSLATQQASESQEQASAVTTINTTMHELSQVAENIRKSAEYVYQDATGMYQTSQLIMQATGLVVSQSETGIAAVGYNIDACTAVAQQYQELQDRLDHLNTSSKNMSRIIDVLNSISGETHLLSLNAAIEAAGAGPYGARFAVVAGEIKKLALHARTSSAEISKIVREIEEIIAFSVEGVKNGQQKALAMHDVAQKTGQVIEQMGGVVGEWQHQAESIIAMAQKMKTSTQEIRAATTQQQEGSAQVLHELENFSQVARHNAEASSLISTTAEDLDNAVLSLNRALSV